MLLAGHRIVGRRAISLASRPSTGDLKKRGRQLFPSLDPVNRACWACWERPQRCRLRRGLVCSTVRAPSCSATLASLPLLFGEAQQAEQLIVDDSRDSEEKVLLGVDPDNSGAVAVLKLAGRHNSMQSLLQAAEIRVHDMPCTRVAVGKRHRRQADPAAIVRIVRAASAKAGAAGLRCLLEEPVPGPANGRHSLFGAGFAFGVWSGVLASFQVGLDTVTARRWKNDLGLNGCGKEGSRALAMAVFPQAADQLGRKKDHGRAEAMLILAWGLGLRIPKASETVQELRRAHPLPSAGRREAVEQSSEEALLAEDDSELSEDALPAEAMLTAVHS